MRYSSDAQTEQSIEGQRRECQKFASANNYTIIGEYADRALTGRADKRPDFQRMIKDSNKHLFEYVIVYQLDRFSRSRYDSAHYKHVLKKNGVKVLSAKENITDDASGILMETMLEGMAEYYSAELSQKVRRGQYESFLKGNTIGGNHCYGFDAVPTGQPTASGRVSKKFVINNAEAEIIRKIFNDYAGGKTVKEIIQWLDANGVVSRNGKPMPINSVLNILNNIRYTGALKYGDEILENVIPRIIDDETFAKVQAKRKRNKKNPNSYKARERYMLSSKLICGYCKSIIGADCGTSKTGVVYRYYKCDSKKRYTRRKDCDKTQVDKNWLEMTVVSETLALLNKNGMIKSIADQLVKYNDETQINPLLEIYEKQLQEIDKEIDNIMNAVSQGFVSKTMQERILKLESDKADLESRIEHEKLNVPVKIDYLDIVHWLNRFKDGDIENPDFRERIIDTFVSKVILWNARMIIVYNVKGVDGKNISIDQIIKEVDNQFFLPQEFDSHTLTRTTSRRFVLTFLCFGINF